MATATQAPVQSLFGNRLRPRDITDDVRAELAACETRLERFIIVSTGTILGFLSFGLWTYFRFYNWPRVTEFGSVLPFMISFAPIAFCIHLAFQRRRRMWLTWPATSAVVTHVDFTCHCFRHRKPHRPELTLRYLSQPNSVLDPDQVTWTLGAHESTTLPQGPYHWALSLHENSLVTVVYDPDNPERVHPVELEYSA